MPEFQRMVPSVGSARPEISRSAVDLPQPDGPSSERNSPRAPCNYRSPLQRGDAVRKGLADAVEGEERGRGHQQDILSTRTHQAGPSAHFGRSSLPTPLFTNFVV